MVTPLSNDPMSMEAEVGGNLSRREFTRLSASALAGAAVGGGLVACSNGSEEVVSRVTEDGVTIVRNPAEPAFRGGMRLERVFDIGLSGMDPSDDPRYVLGSISRAAVGHDVVAVADRAEAEIRLFNSEGRHLHTFGERGEGPGEFEFLDHIALDEHGLVALERTGRLSSFDLQGEYIGRVNVDDLIGPLSFRHLAKAGSERVILHVYPRRLLEGDPPADGGLILLDPSSGDWTAFGPPREYPHRQVLVSELDEAMGESGGHERYVRLIDHGSICIDERSESLYLVRQAAPDNILEYSMDGRLRRELSREVEPERRGIRVREFEEDEDPWSAGRGETRVTGLVVDPEHRERTGRMRYFQLIEESMGVARVGPHIASFYRVLRDDEWEFDHFADLYDAESGRYEHRVPLDVHPVVDLSRPLAGADRDGAVYFATQDEDLGFHKVSKFDLRTG